MRGEGRDDSLFIKKAIKHVHLGHHFIKKDRRDDSLLYMCFEFDTLGTISHPT